MNEYITLSNNVKINHQDGMIYLSDGQKVEEPLTVDDTIDQMSRLLGADVARRLVEIVTNADVPKTLIISIYITENRERVFTV